MVILKNKSLTYLIAKIISIVETKSKDCLKSALIDIVSLSAIMESKEEFELIWLVRYDSTFLVPIEKVTEKGKFILCKIFIIKYKDSLFTMIQEDEQLKM